MTSTNDLTGLTSAEVEQARSEGRVNDTQTSTGRSVGQIIRANVFTLSLIHI